ncbi:MAG: pyridoxamine 5'-phosphate oxidase family protein [Candidatus Cloacimonetes bacterium]|nr:pyridoxamine 5'-phosphate oxidase family protein [Candidatus Cloacimonadota bacterium]
MRRTDKELTDRTAIEDILRHAQVCRLAMFDGAEPYIVPLNYGYTDGCLYFHSALQGRKLDILRQHPRVCFEVSADMALVRTAKSWSMDYDCVIGWGEVEIVEDASAKRAALDVLVRHYAEPWNYPAATVDRTCVLCLRIERMTGKRSRHD